MGFFDDDDWDYDPDDNGTGAAVSLAIVAGMIMFAMFAMTIAAAFGGIICVLAWIVYAVRERAETQKQKRQFQKMWWKERYSYYGALSPNELMNRQARADFERDFNNVWNMYRAEQKKTQPAMVKWGKRIAAGFTLLLIAATITATAGRSVAENIEAGNKAEMARQADMSLHDIPAAKYLDDYDSRTHYSLSEAMEIQPDTEPGGTLAIGNYGTASLNVQVDYAKENTEMPCFVEILDIRTGDAGKDMMYYVGESKIFPDEEEIDDYQYAFVQFILPPDYADFKNAVMVRDVEEPDVDMELFKNTDGGLEEVRGSGVKCISHFYGFTKVGMAQDGYFAVRYPKDDGSYNLSFSINGSQYYCSLAQ